MTCREMDDLLVTLASGAPLPPEAARHVAECPRCRRLLDAMRGMAQPAPPSSAQLGPIKSAILADLKPVRPMAPAVAFFAALMFIFFAAAAAGVVELGHAGWLALDALQRVAIFSALVAGAALLTVSLSRQMVPGRRLMVPPAVLVTAVFLVVISLVAMLFHPHPESTFMATGLVCLRIGLECAFPAGLLFWLVLRRGAILNPLLTAATAGALAGLSGLTLLEIFCPNPNVWHILVWHLGAVLVSALGGGAIGWAVEHYGRRQE